MKKSFIRLSAVLLALVMALAALGCKLTDETVPPEDASAASDTDNDAVAVSIGGGEYTITRGEVEEMYNSFVAQYASMGMPAPTADADIESMQDSIVDMLAAEKVLLYQAEQMGVTLDQNAKDGVEADLEDEMAEITSTFRAQAESEGAEDVDARTVEIFNERLAASGMDMDMDGYRAFRHDAYEQQAIAAALESRIKSEITATDEEGRAYYDDLLATQKETYGKNPEYYLDDQEYYEKFGGNPILVTPEG